MLTWDSFTHVETRDGGSDCLHAPCVSPLLSQPWKRARSDLWCCRNFSCFAVTDAAKNKPTLTRKTSRVVMCCPMKDAVTQRANLWWDAPSVPHNKSSSFQSFNLYHAEFWRLEVDLKCWLLDKSSSAQFWINKRIWTKLQQVGQRHITRSEIWTLARWLLGSTMPSHTNQLWLTLLQETDVRLRFSW